MCPVTAPTARGCRADLKHATQIKRSSFLVRQREQLLKLYGPHDASTLEARFRIKVVCSLGICETRERVVTKYAGRRTIETWEANGKDGRIRRETEIDVIAANYLTDELGVREVGKRLFVRVVIFGLGNPAIVEIPFTQWRERRAAYVLADWAAAAD